MDENAVGMTCFDPMLATGSAGCIQSSSNLPFTASRIDLVLYETAHDPPTVSTWAARRFAQTKLLAYEIVSG
jgi:hypothetical protein